MNDQTAGRDGLSNSKFTLEVVALTLFGGLVVLLLGPAFSTDWLAIGAVVGAVYWTVMYDARLAGLQSKLPGERATMLVGFLYVVAVAELVSDPARQSSLIAGFIAGFIVAGVVDAGRARLVQRLESS
ncbi:hypothetical protein [Salinibaculum salinum]|uniref:hypothetical protein n=1 Tax=Salinibaculum salinum TaxID=3131996 RepID=UPI0030ED6F90